MNKEIKLHTIAIFNNKEYELEELMNNLLNKLEAYENMRKEAIKFIKEDACVFDNPLEEFKCADILLNILNKVGDSDEKD